MLATLCTGCSAVQCRAAVRACVRVHSPTAALAAWINGDSQVGRVGRWCRTLSGAHESLPHRQLVCSPFSIAVASSHLIYRIRPRHSLPHCAPAARPRCAHMRTSHTARTRKRRRRAGARVQARCSRGAPSAACVRRGTAVFRRAQRRIHLRHTRRGQRQAQLGQARRRRRADPAGAAALRAVSLDATLERCERKDTSDRPRPTAVPVVARWSVPHRRSWKSRALQRITS